MINAFVVEVVAMPFSPMTTQAIAVLIPCYNEAASIESVIRDFHAILPEATTYVYDNNSNDNSALLAQKAGAVVRHVASQGKGFVVQRMFAEIEADIYVLVDGDATYDAASSSAMIAKLLEDNLEMVVAKRVHSDRAAYRYGHVWGNRFLTWAVACIFGKKFSDILSGYRIFSRAFVKSLDCFSKGFEVETDITVHALMLNMPVGEVESPYRARPVNSSSKLHTWSDGFAILMKILSLFMYESPKVFFGIFSAALLGLAVVLAIPLVGTWLSTGLVPRIPTAVLCSAITAIAVTMQLVGLLLDSMRKTRRALRYFAYLAQKSQGKRT